MKLRVLIVEDNQYWQNILRSNIQTWMEHIGLAVEIRVAGTYESAVGIIQHETPDFALVDLQIPFNTLDFDAAVDPLIRGGIGVLRQLRMASECAALVVTANGNMNIAQDIRRDYSVHYSINKESIVETFESLHDRVSDALFSTMVAHAAAIHQQRQRLTLVADEQGWLRAERSGNGTMLDLMDDRVQIDMQDHIRRAARLWDMISRDAPHIWRPELRSIGMATHAEFTRLAHLQQNLDALPTHPAPVLHLVGHPQWLRVPFELMNDGDHWLALDYAIARRLRFKNPTNSTKTEAFGPWLETTREAKQPVRVLIVGANSDGQIPQVETEARNLEQLYHQVALLYNLNMPVDCLVGSSASSENIRAALSDGQYHIFHFAGHSGYHATSGELSYLVIGYGKQKAYLTASDLFTALRAHPLRLAFISSCWSGHTQPDALHSDFNGILPAIVQADTPVAVGYRWAVADQSASLFSQTFHTQLWKSLLATDALLAARRSATLQGARRNDDTWFSSLLVSQNGD